MPRDSHRTVGKLLALSFWEDFAVLDQMVAYIPTISWLCVAPAPPHTLSTYVHTHRDSLSYRVLYCPESLAVWAFCVSGTLLNLKRSLDLNYQLYLVP